MTAEGLNRNASHPCPVCELENAFPELGSFAQCPRCGWYDDPIQADNPDLDEGDNQPMTLNQAREAWKSGRREDEWRKTSYFPHET